MNKTPFLHKKIRLPAHRYRGGQGYFVTICCDERRQIFGDAQKAKWVVEILRQEAEAGRFAIHAYCVMPDHIHFLAEGLDANTDLLAFMKRFKAKTSFAYARETKQRLWQKKFYDHILRPKENADSVAWYIFLNPVRKGLRKELVNYPFSGSFTFDLRKKSTPNEIWVPWWKKKA